MAEGVLFNIAGAVLKKVGNLALQEIVLLWGLYDDLNDLQCTVSTINAVLLDAEKQYSTSNQVKLWLDDLKDAVYDADDLLADISTKASRLQRMSGNVVTKEVILCFSRSNRVTYGLKMAHKIRDVRARLDKIADRKKFHLNPNHVEPPIVVSTHSSPPSEVIGRDGDKKRIISLLLGHQQETVAVIPIVGFGGLGKTTLAQTVYKDELVKSHFELRIWVCVSDTFNVKSVVEKIIECLDGEKTSQNLEMETLKNKLSSRIGGKRYMLVLDAVWNEDREEWLQLYRLIVNGARGSRVVITTRSSKVAEITSIMPPYELKGLSKIESWDLFQQVAFKQGKAPNEEFERLGMEIAAKCVGLPLAIRTIGSLLYSRSEVCEWKSFKDEEFQKIDPESNILGTLKLSYNHLPSNLKQCFSYCSLFPKDYLFKVSTIINHWRAQEYIDTSKSSVNSFKYLLQGSFFQLANENDRDGDELTYRMHDFMHDLAVLVSGDEINMVCPNLSGKTVTQKNRHMSLHDIPREQQWQRLSPLLQRRNARSLIVQRSSFSGYSTKSGDKQCRAIVNKLRCLRVLTLHRFEIKKLPRSVNRLDHLAHLDLTGNELERLPDSITHLQKLQVLILDDCYRLRQLPRDMKKLVNLIHLGLEGCYSLKEMPLGIGQLTALEVLSRFSLSKERRMLPKITGGLDELQNLNKLSGTLKINNLQYLKKGAWECEAANLKDKPQLRNLELDWGSRFVVEDTRCEEKSLEALEPHVNLRELRLEYYGGVRFPRWVSSLGNLLKVKINNCHNCKSLPSLDWLLFLQHLEIKGLDELEYIIDDNGDPKGEGRSCFFPSLKTLILKYCPKLKGWWRSTEEPLDCKLPCLSKMEIEYCRNLKGWMPQLPSLENLSLSWTSLELMEETLKSAKLSSTSTGTSLSPLRYLSIERTEDFRFLREEALQSLASLKSLYVERITDTSVLAPWLHHLSSLESLTIEYCGEMNLFVENSTELIQSCLGNLRTLSIESCHEIKSLPKGIQHLTSLQTLKISFCEELEALPAWMGNLASLNTLHISLCPHLTERCRSNQVVDGDWPLISHIPNILVDYKWVQRNGSYQL